MTPELKPAQPPALRGSAGLGGTNQRDDVFAVQSLLREAGLDPGPVDGICGPRTIAAIQRYQGRFLPDAGGLVDPDGSTWRKLTGVPPGTDDQPPHAPDFVKPEWSGACEKWSQAMKLLSMDPDLRTRVQAAMAELRNLGFRPRIFFGWRSAAAQRELFQAGKTGVLFSFHNAQRPDGTPNAYAADIIDERWGWDEAAEEHGFWEALGKAARTHGLIWGGDWKSPHDPAHVQNRQNYELAAVRKESGL